jgi:hypothetical protein
MLSALGSENLADFVKQVFELLKHLGGEPPKSIAADRGGVSVRNNSGEMVVFNQSVVNMVVEGPAGRTSEQFARGPLQHEADAVEISVNGELAAQADKDSADCFVPIGPDEEISEFVNDLYLEIRTVVLEGDAQWRFDDGRNKFPAKIEDKQFLQRIQEGRERFGKGDMLRVRLRSRQERAKGQLKTTHVIEKIFEHERSQHIQGDLL